MFVGIYAVLVSHPTNIAVVEGSPVKLDCAVNDTQSPIRWFHRKDSESEEAMIYSGNQITNSFHNFSIDKTSPGEYHLILNQTTMSSAGTYTCNEFKTRMNASAQVIVMGELYETT